MRVKIVRQPKGRYENAPFAPVGETMTVSPEVGAALVRFKYAEAAEDGDADPAPAETANSRETREDGPSETRG